MIHTSMRATYEDRASSTSLKVRANKRREGSLLRGPELFEAGGPSWEQEPMSAHFEALCLPGGFGRPRPRFTVFRKL